MKYAICILAHHKPWLIMSSLVSLAMQDVDPKDYDLHIIYIKGNGEFSDSDEYKKYNEIKEKTKNFNKQLSKDDARIINILDKTKFNITIHEVFNDHSLDSGAWYKFIKKGIWKNYDYIFCYMEGFLFTSKQVLGALKKFINLKNPDFISAGHEKRILHRSIVDSYVCREKNVSEMDNFHQTMINRIYKDFCKDKKFKLIYDKWNDDPFFSNQIKKNTQHHVPDQIYHWTKKLRLFLKYFLSTGKLYNPFQKLVLEVNEKGTNLLPLKKLVNNYEIIDNVVFHDEISPYYFGCSCQHIFSKKFLEKFHEKCEESNFYNIINYPFSGSALEIIWGFFPSLLGFKKWYYDGQHRPRKNFTNLKLEDNQEGVCRYLNLYFKNQIYVTANGDYINIKKINNKKTNLIYNILGNSFFKKNV